MLKIIVTIEGPDAKKALAELVANAQYDKLDVNFVVKEIDKGSEFTYPAEMARTTRTVKAMGTALTAYGKRLHEPVRYEYSWERGKDRQEDYKRKNNARAKARELALEAAGITKPERAEDDEVKH
jgi:hypothetical protein